MAGLIQNAGATALTPEFIRSKMQLPPQLQQAYERVVMAGKKIMYSEQMQPHMKELLKGKGSIGDKLGDGVVMLMGLLYAQSNHTLPPGVVIPAATELVVEAADFLRKAGMKVTDHDIAEGIAAMIAQVMQRAKISPDQLRQSFQQQQQQQQPVPGMPDPRAPAQPLPQGA